MEGNHAHEQFAYAMLSVLLGTRFVI